MSCPYITLNKSKQKIRAEKNNTDTPSASALKGSRWLAFLCEWGNSAEMIHFTWEELFSCYLNELRGFTSCSSGKIKLLFCMTGMSYTVTEWWPWDWSLKLYTFPDRDWLQINMYAFKNQCLQLYSDLYSVIFRFFFHRYWMVTMRLVTEAV